MPNSAESSKPNTMYRLTGRIAFVTGGAGGIGEAIAKRLASEGASVAIVDTDEAKGQRIADTISSEGGSSTFINCDIRFRDQVRASAEIAQQRLGPITILVNNAGIGLRAPFLDMSDEIWRAVIETNLTGAFIVAQEVCQKIVKNGGGSVVNMASTAARMANSEQTAYSVAKAGLEAMTRVMAFELAPLGVRVNAVAPGTISTGLLSAMLTEHAKSERIRRIPAGRFGTPDEVAVVVAFLVSEDAKYITACSLPIDGGLLPAGIRA